MKLKSKCNPIPIATGFKLPKMHGHMDITLRNVKTGEVEEIHHDNIITNAIQYYFANCGFMNYPSIDKSQLVELLMGGIMCFDDVIDGDDPSPTTVLVPAGLKMTANAAQGMTSNVDGEQGTATANTAETTYNGWQADGSYTHTYEWNTGQGNGTINSVCLAGRNYAWAGEGNSTSLRRHTTKTDITNLAGGANSHSGVTGYPFNIDFTNSTCHTFAIETRTDQEDQEYTTGVLRLYRLPITKLDLRGKPTAPVLLSEEEIEIDADLISANGHDYVTAPFIRTQPLGNKLVIWNCNAYRYIPVWGTNWNQYVWTVDASTKTVTKETITNTSGDDLPGLQCAIFDGNYVFFCKAYGGGSPGSSTYPTAVDSRTIYILNRTSGVITPISNPYGAIQSTSANMTWLSLIAGAGMNYYHGSGDGKIMTTGNYPFVVDAELEACYPTNASTTTLGSEAPTLSPLIRAIGINLYRDQGYIASINNLDSPVVKTSEKSMKITYRITFEEEESNA